MPYDRKMLQEIEVVPEKREAIFVTLAAAPENPFACIPGPFDFRF